MQDRPTAVELLTAVREFIEMELVPGLEGRRRFHGIVAANILSIVARELAGEETALVGEWRRLRDLLAVDETVPPGRLDGLRAAVCELTQRLCERIRNGGADTGAFADAVRTHVRMTVVEKLRIANPKYVGAVE